MSLTTVSPLSSESPGQVSLLEARSLVLGGTTPLSVGSMKVTGPWISCAGTAAALISAAQNPELIKEGSVLVEGELPSELLKNCAAAYVPTKLPLPESTRVLSAIHLSGQLVGLSKQDAEEALARCRLSAHGNKKLGELTRLQQRLVGLAHGISGAPRILIMEDLFADLDEAETEIIEALLDRELADRSLIVSVASASPGSRSLMLRTNQVLLGTGTEMLPPQSPEVLSTEGFWVTCSGDVGELARLLQEEGARVVRSPRASVLLAHRAEGLTIYRAAQRAGLSVLELSPNSANGFAPTRAKSGA